MTKPVSEPKNLDELMKAVLANTNQNGAPVHLWDPPYCGELDMVIHPDGQWYYNKTPIGREKLVRLFASVLKREGDQYYLVTPVEKIGIQVMDAAFSAVILERHGSGREQVLHFTTNVGDKVVAGPEHELRFDLAPRGETLKPYLHVRDRLEARLCRSVYYELANYAQEHTIDDVAYLGLWSNGVFYPIDSVAHCEGDVSG